MQIQLFALLMLFFESLLSCQAPPGETGPAVASIDYRVRPGLERSLPPSAKNIVFQSLDGGQTWLDISEGLPENVQPISLLAADGQLLLGASRGLYSRSVMPPVAEWEEEMFVKEEITGIFPGQGGPFVLSHRDGFYIPIPTTNLWTALHENLADELVFAVLETRSGALLAACETGIYRTADHGKTWQLVSEEADVMNLAEANEVLIAGNARGVLRSTDDGRSWSAPLGGEGTAIRTCRIDGGLAAILDANEPSHKLYISTDEGATWKRKNLPPALRSIYDLQQAGEYLFAACDAGIFRSADKGATWEQAQPTPPGTGSFFKLYSNGEAIFVLRIDGC